jgi:hypothetical protein
MTRRFFFSAQLRFKSSNESELPKVYFSVAGEACDMPAPLAVGDDGVLHFTPDVNYPGPYRLTTDDGKVSGTFVVAALPCATSGGGVGYCLPTASIDGMERDGLTCTDGDPAPCGALNIDGIGFRCCAGSASDVTRLAQYRSYGDILPDDARSLRCSLASLLLATLVASLFSS